MTIAFATIFNNISILRMNFDGTVAQCGKIPIDYGPQQHYITKLKQREIMTSDEHPLEISTYLPRMSFEIAGIEYRKEEQRNPMNVHKQYHKDTNLMHYGPAPYTINMTLSIYSKNTEDMLMIVEQILPMFTPHLNLRIKAVDSMNEFKDITIKINGVSPEDNYIETLETSRLLTWTLDFSVNGDIYPPYNGQGLITKSIVEFDNSYITPPEELEKVVVEANQKVPPDYDKDNSTVSIIPAP